MSRDRTGHCRDLLKCVKSMGRMTHRPMEAAWIILGNNLDYMDHICKNDKLGRGLQLIYVDPALFLEKQVSGIGGAAVGDLRKFFYC